ncbi:hypothetical protein [Streptomyces sp. NPDC088254]
MAEIPVGEAGLRLDELVRRVADHQRRKAEGELAAGIPREEVRRVLGLDH